MVIGIFDMAIVEEIKRTIKDEFAQDTKVQTGRDIQCSFENRMLQENYQKMVFQWGVNLEEYFPVWLDYVMGEVEYHVRNDVDCCGGMHEHFIRCRKNHAFSGSFFRMLEQADFGETDRWDCDIEDEKCI